MFTKISVFLKKELITLNALNERSKMMLICLSLLLVLGMLVFTAVGTVRALHKFQQEYSAVKIGDVSTVQPWMTVHEISHVYHIPENYLSQTLTLKDPQQIRHATLYVVASHKRQPVTQVIHTIQRAILTYRHEHPTVFKYPLTQFTSAISPMPGRDIG